MLNNFGDETGEIRAGTIAHPFTEHVMFKGASFQHALSYLYVIIYAAEATSLNQY
jgi:hypothetical protein